MITNQTLIDEYLDYFNNYLTVAKFAEDRGLTLEQGQDLVLLAKCSYQKQFLYEHFQLINIVGGNYL